MKITSLPLLSVKYMLFHHIFKTYLLIYLIYYISHSNFLMLSFFMCLSLVFTL